MPSLIKTTWVTLEFGNHEYDHVHGYDHVVNIATDVVLGPNEPGYDLEKFSALMGEVRAYLRRYDKVNVISGIADQTGKQRVRRMRADSATDKRCLDLPAAKSKQFV